MSAQRKPAVVCWSGGKDSAMALHRIRKQDQYDIRYLLTTINAEFRRISMHGIREELLDRQAHALGLPLLKVYVQEGTNAEYEAQMAKTLAACKSEGIADVIFGDIFLEDLRAYREEKLKAVGMQAIFPLWKERTSHLSTYFIREGFASVLCCVRAPDPGEFYAGRTYDQELLSALPAHIDPCGEYGEFHTFCHAGPIFRHAIPYQIGETVYRELPEAMGDTTGFYYTDLLPEPSV